MQEFFSTDKLFYRILTFIYHLFIYNILWIICSLPIVTIGASTTALFVVTEKLMKDEVNNEFKEFFSNFKKYFKKSTSIWLALIVAYLVIFLNLRISQTIKNYGTIIYLIQLPILLQVVIININIFIMISKYEIPTLKLIKLSWIIGNKHIFASIMSIAAIFAWTTISVKIPPLFIFLFISVAAIGIYILFNHIIERYKVTIEGD